MGALFRIRGFLPYFVMVFLNAFVDLGHKIIIQNAILKIYDGHTQIILTAVVNGLILLPFILLFSPAGFLSDRFPKERVIRYSAWMAIAATLLITFTYYSGWFLAAFALTLLLAIQSAIYSPAKYGFIRELVGSESLVAANGAIQAVTIVAILSGTFVFSGFFEWLLQARGYQSADDIMTLIAPLGWALVGLSVVELLLAYKLPHLVDGDERQVFSPRNYVSGQYLRRNLRTIRSQRIIWISIIGLSLFWAICQVVLASFPAYAKDVLAEDNTLIIQGILASAGIGIVIGSICAGRVSEHHIELGLIPVGAVGVALSVVLLTTLESYVGIIAIFIALGTFGGLFIVPLNALIQYHARHRQLGRVMAGSNWFQTLIMALFLGLTALLAALGLDTVQLFYLLAVIAIAGTFYTLRQLPQAFARIIASALLKRRYRLEVMGFEHLPKRGGVLLLGNHISWLDWAFIQMASPRPIRFVIIRSIYNKPYLKPFLKAFGAIPISSGHSKRALRDINACLKNGEVVCLFPEGSISRNGHLGQFKRGYERTVANVRGVIVPFYLHGLWGSSFSRSSSRLKKLRAGGIKRDIIVAFGEQLPLETPAPELKQQVIKVSVDAWKKHTDQLPPVPLAWLQRARGQLRETCAVDALTDQRISHGKMIAATLGFARLIKQETRGESAIGLMLPATPAAMICNMACLLNGQTAVNLNYTTPAAAVQSGINNAEVKTVFTSEKFLRKLEQRGLDTRTLLQGTRVILLEELRTRLSKPRLFTYLLLGWLLPAGVLYRLFGKPVELDDPAAILFSSGSEGTPKGIVLSHRNFMCNIKQISDVLDTRDEDVFMGGLPPFHSFGLTATTLLPMVEGIPVVCHPDPTDVLNCAKAIYRYQATLLLGTATFLRLYSRNKRVDPLMLESLRIVVAGAEKLSSEVRQSFELKFNRTIYEGYGATETTPVASVNIPNRLDPDDWQVQVGNKPGTVGLPVPGSCSRIVDPETLEPLPTGEDGLILIAGHQVMLGYLKDEARTRDVILELDGQRWYKTGDKGHLDEQGFLTIVDRYSRFAKLGGEMVSLGAVEARIQEIAAANALAEEMDVLAVSIPDVKKGEKVVVLVQGHDAPAELRQTLIEASMDSLQLPAEILPVDSLPTLGSGKKDFQRARQLVLELLESSTNE